MRRHFWVGAVRCQVRGAVSGPTGLIGRLADGRIRLATRQHGQLGGGWPIRCCFPATGGQDPTTLGGGYPFRRCFPATGGQDPDDVGWQLPDSEPFTFVWRGLKLHLMEDNAPQSGNHHPTAPTDPPNPTAPTHFESSW